VNEGRSEGKNEEFVTNREAHGTEVLGI